MKSLQFQSSIILHNWNPVRDFAVGAKSMNGVEKAFGKNGSQNGRANSKDMKNTG